MINIATTTPNYGLHVTPESDVEKGVLAFRTEQAGDDAGSNIMMLDRIIKDLQDNKASKVNGKIPAEELPSYVDDVLEFELYSLLPSPGEQGKIYVVFGDTSELNGQYRWTGTVYSSISNQIDFATKEEAENGVNNSKAMTALRSKELVNAMKGTPNGIAETDSSNIILPKHLPSNLMIYDDSEIGDVVPVDADTLSGKSLLALEADMQQKSDNAEANAKAASVPLAQKGIAGGVAPLGADGLVPVSHLPSQVKERQVVGTIAERNAIAEKFSGLQVYVRDATADPTVTKGGADYLWDGSAWIKTGEAESMDVVLKWENVTEKPETFPAAPHGHAIEDVIELDAALSRKADSNQGYIPDGSDVLVWAEQQTSDCSFAVGASCINIPCAGFFCAHLFIGANEYRTLILTKDASGEIWQTVHAWNGSAWSWTTWSRIATATQVRPRLLAGYSVAGNVTFVVPQRITKILVCMIGGGGGGGGATQDPDASQNGFAYNGASGVVSVFFENVTPGQSINGIVGAGGIGGRYSSLNGDGRSGATGATTSFDAKVAYGGGGGFGGRGNGDVAIGGQSAAGGAYGRPIFFGALDYLTSAKSKSFNEMLNMLSLFPLSKFPFCAAVADGSSGIVYTLPNGNMTSASDASPAGVLDVMGKKGTDPGCGGGLAVVNADRSQYKTSTGSAGCDGGIFIYDVSGWD